MGIENCQLWNWNQKEVNFFSIFATSTQRFKMLQIFNPTWRWGPNTTQELGQPSYVYTSGHCGRWHSCMQVKIVAGSFFVHCEITYFNSVTTAQWLVITLQNIVTISRKIFSWIRTTKPKIYAVELCHLIKDFVSQSGLFVPHVLTVMSTWQCKLTAHCPIGEHH